MSPPVFPFFCWWCSSQERPSFAPSRAAETSCRCRDPCCGGTDKRSWRFHQKYENSSGLMWEWFLVNNVMWIMWEYKYEFNMFIYFHCSLRVVFRASFPRLYECRWIMWETQCNKPPIWGWFLPPITGVMTWGWFISWAFQSHGCTPNHPVVMDDHDDSSWNPWGLWNPPF